MKRLIKNGTVITANRTNTIYDDADILINDGQIEAIGKALHAPDAEILDATHMIVIPGLINAHVHLWQTAMRGAGVDWTGVEHHLRMQTGYSPQLSPAEIGLSECYGALNLLNSGVTTVFDWCHGCATPDHSSAAVEGIGNSGIRALFGHGTVKTLPQPGEQHFSQIPHDTARATVLHKQIGSIPLVDMALAILGPDYSPLDVCRQDIQLARELGIPTTAHVSGHPGKVPDGYFRLHSEGLLDSSHNVVHACAMSDEEARLIVDSGASITATPTSEISEGANRPMLCRVERLGGHASLGTDSEANVSSDMFQAMRHALSIERLFNNLESRTPATAAATNRVERGMEIPPRITPGCLSALRWATIESAKALKIDAKVGSLEPGKRADVTLVRKLDWNISPASDPIVAIVGFASPMNVDTVIVDGQIKKRHGQLLNQHTSSEMAANLRDIAHRLEVNFHGHIR